MRSALINFHSLVTVWAPQLTDEFQTFLSERFPPFYRQQVSEPPVNPDIIIEPMKELPLVTDASSHIYAIFGFSVFDFRGEVAVGVMHRGQPDVLLVFSNPFKIFYRPRARNRGRLYGMLLLGLSLCLRSKNALLVHGAVVERDGQTLLFSGHRGSGKTPIACEFYASRLEFHQR